ncbi:MAG: hypothetical protein Q4E46_03100 [Candidatus Saccharibacteria bacterium]|nr:hypothetical protein [Candidatus Saccharibacteria bacterium]MBR1795662.1 hypothetical protein [Candidatus Saccharibacteria bacterium]MDO4987272.1 hypothetical protein [Candidatus Saccharibacteria bacterium]
MSNNINNLKKGAEADGSSPFDYQYMSNEGMPSKNNVAISEHTRAQIEDIKRRKVKIGLGKLLLWDVA